MCSHTQVLSRCNSFRNIAYCDCQGGLFHICWDIATLHLCNADFIKLTSILEQMHQDSSKSQHLWIGTVGVLLSPHDFIDFHQLVQQALRTLKPYLEKSHQVAITPPN